MRSILLAALASVALPACVSDIAGVSGGDDTHAPTCGNGVVDPGETCDDGNTNNGDGCSSTCQVENTTVPRVALIVDNATISTDLNVVSAIMVTATSEMGFTGAVTLAAVSDVADWKAMLATTTVTLTAGGTATAMLTIRAMGDTTALTGSVKVTATDSGPASDVSVAATFNPTLDVFFKPDSNGVATYDTDFVGPTHPYKIKAGRGIKVYNGSTTKMLTVHVSGNIAGFPHESTAVGAATAPGNAYTGTTASTDVGNSADFWTHNGGATAFLDAGNGNAVATIQPRLDVVQ